MEYKIGTDEPISTAVVRATSAVTGREPCSLPPLADVIDPDALDSLFGPQYNGVTRPGGRLSFTYSGYQVIVERNEYVYIESVETNDRTVGVATQEHSK